MRYRPAAPGDLPTILGLWRALQTVSAAFEPRLTPGPTAADWFAEYLRGQMDNENAAVVVAEIGGDVVGYTFGQILRRPTLAAGDCGYVADLCVRADRRGRGIGRGLFQTLRGWFAERGILALEVQVVRANPASQAFWRKMGFADFLRTLRTEM